MTLSPEGERFEAEGVRGFLHRAGAAQATRWR